MSKNGPVGSPGSERGDSTAPRGRHAAPRATNRPGRTSGRSTGRVGVLLSAIAITCCVLAWGYLIFAAIDFGASARQGDQRGWLFLALATVGAIACLFVGLLLVARLIATLRTPPVNTPAGADQVVDSARPVATVTDLSSSSGTLTDPEASAPGAPEPPMSEETTLLPRTVAGKRAAR